MATINSSSEPLYIVDGVAMEDFSLVNPNDIESMEVLRMPLRRLFMALVVRMALSW